MSAKYASRARSNEPGSTSNPALARYRSFASSKHSIILNTASMLRTPRGTDTLGFTFFLQMVTYSVSGFPVTVAKFSMSNSYPRSRRMDSCSSP